METQMETYPILFVVDDFGVEYIGKQHADHLATILKKSQYQRRLGGQRICWY